jgi:CRISPR-associated exonuclease Cas4
VACTRARDLLILPHIPQASKDSWFSSIDLRQQDIPELDVSSFARRETPGPASRPNAQSSDIFAAEQRSVEESAPPVLWRRPSEHDADRLGDPLTRVVILESYAEHLEVVGAGARRGVILHKLMEELLIGELAGELGASVARARELLHQLVSDVNDDKSRPDPNEMAAAALRGLALPEIAELRPHLVPEIAIWGHDEVGLLAGRADALAIIEERVDAAIDWKSDVNPTPAVREAHVQQLHEYLSATGALRGAIVYLTSGEVAWILRS